MVCTSCKTLYNVLNLLGTGWSCAYGEGGRGGGGLIIDSRGVMQKKDSPEFRFPEFGISAVVRCSLV